MYYLFAFKTSVRNLIKYHRNKKILLLYLTNMTKNIIKLKTHNNNNNNKSTLVYLSLTVQNVHLLSINIFYKIKTLYTGNT